MEQGYDVIVLGGGSAGCVAATRLSEDPGRRVLLLEAGADPRPIPEMVSSSVRQPALMLESEYMLMYPVQRRIDGSIYYNLSGRIMGGGSSVNAMSTLRPLKHDLDTWVALGNPDWSYENMLPILKRLESDQDFPDSPLHGATGPLYVKRGFTLGMETAPPVKAFLDRAQAMGLPLCPDLNVPDPLGVCASPYNIKDGRRQSVVVSYLDLARNRPNLTIVSEAAVESLRIEGAKVQEVVYRKDGQQHRVTGDKIVLSAGALHSPQLLMLSGIGPAADLRRLGARVVRALEGVGENYQDHAGVAMTFEGRTEFRPDWVVPRFRLIIKSDPSRPCGNFHINMRPPTEVAGIKRMMPVTAHLLEQTNRGRLWLSTPDPAALPEIDSQMLEHPDDLKAMVSAMQFMYDLVQHPSMAEFYGPMLQPAPQDDWGVFARSTYESYQHPAGTCMMGPASNPMAVVDQRLRVHGMDNLWVADASIMPNISHANTNITSIMIGERVSDIIKAGG